MFTLVLTYDLYFILDSKNTFTVREDHEHFLTIKGSLYFKSLLTQCILYTPVCVCILLNLTILKR